MKTYYILLLVVVLLLSEYGVQQTAAAVHAERTDSTSQQSSEKSSTLDSLLQSLRDKIKHVIVLMEENRSFDHMMGWFKGVDGLTGKEYNLINTRDFKSKKVFVSDKAPYINRCDPAHSLLPTTYKIFGPEAAEHKNYTHPTMEGFVQYEYEHSSHSEAKTTYCNVLDGFPPHRVPIMKALAENFVSMDRMHASVPGPTWPNRLFFMSGTSAGLTETYPWYHNINGKLFPQRTIFDQVKEGGGQWKVYYNDTPWELFVETIAHNPEHIHPMSQFFEDAKHGNLPDFGYINPRSGINITTGEGSNDQHPDHDVALGEAYYKDIYEALRSSPQWNETLFVLTYDEHGGFYDHVPPPMNIPPPGDGEASYPDKDFTFDRLGIRIPTLLISPWVPKGMVLSEPPSSQCPAHNSAYDLTSIIATTRKLLRPLKGAPPLTKRDGWAATFEHVLSNKAPRTDCPVHLPPAPPPSKGFVTEEATQPVNELQQHIMTVHAHLAHEEKTYPKHITQQGHVGPFVEKAFALHKERTLQWKQSKLQHQKRSTDNELTSTMEVVISFFNDDHEKKKPYLHKWNVTRGGTVPFQLIHGLSHHKSKRDICLSVAQLKPHAPVTATNCYPSTNPDHSRDRMQQWEFRNDATIRPYQNSSLCVTNTFLQTGDVQVFLDTCISGGDVRQTYAYHGGAPGSGNSGLIVFGDGSTVIAVIKKE